MKKSLFILGFVAVLTVIYLSGPVPEEAELSMDLPGINLQGQELENWIDQREHEVTGLKEDNHARIIWYDSLKGKTPYSLVYLHGFSASQGEEILFTVFTRRNTE